MRVAEKIELEASLPAKREGVRRHSTHRRHIGCQFESFEADAHFTETYLAAIGLTA